MMERVRVRYTKDSRVRYVSARDLASVWERALRRADLPIAYSEGFTPHPKVSFPDALPVGVASTGEYAELTFAAPATQGLGALSATLPDGMDILHHHIVTDGEPKLARLLQATLWEVVYPATDAADADEIARTLRTLGARLMAAEDAPVTRTRPGGTGDDTKVVDLRPGIVAIHATTGSGAAGAPPFVPTIRAIIRNDGPSVRPGDLHDILMAHRAPNDVPLPRPQLLRRVAQGRVVDGGLVEALSGEYIPLEVAPSGKRDDRERRHDSRAGGRRP
jgi:radical SAM-linked protein